MNLLLDTHILLWSLLEPERLPSGVARELISTANELWLSPITTWEIMVLASKHKIDLGKESPQKWIKAVYDTIPFKEAALNHQIAIKSRLIKLPHQDPADRFLVASAMVYDLVLVTMDSRLISFPDVKTMSK